MILAEKQQLDPNDQNSLRIYYESLRGWLDNERNSWTQHYQDLAAFMLPRSPRFDYTQIDKGQRKDNNIVDNTATFALRTLGAGLMSGISSPTRAWFHLTTGDLVLDERADIKKYLADVESVIRAVFLKSNVYQTLQKSYQELGLYGTSVFLVAEDEKDEIRCHSYPVGSYYLSGDDTLRIDFCMRIFNMTTRQMVERFGFENVSTAVQALYVSNAGGVKEQWWPVVHVVHRNRYYGDKLESKFLPWVSVYYELSAYNSPQALLSQSGYNEFPVIAPRWDVTGENFYGNSPAMDCLGDTMALQLMQKRKSQAIDKMVNPPMIAHPSMFGNKMSILPGEVTYVDTREGHQGFSPAYQIDFRVGDLSADIAQHQQRIRRALYEDLFLMLASSDRREVTAEEIRAKQEEKMLVLGPVLERCNDELLKPLIKRAVAILSRNGKLPKLPESLRGKEVRIEFNSILSQAQKMLSIAGIDRLMGFIGQQVAVSPEALDIVDTDKVNREYASLLSVPPDVLRDESEIDMIRQGRAQAMQQQAQADQAQKLAAAGQTLSQTDLRTPSALTALIGQQTGL